LGDAMAPEVDNDHTGGLNLSDVEETSLITLYCRAMESTSRDPILRDEKALELVGKIDPLLAGTDKRLFRRLKKRRVPKILVVHIALRARHYDQCAKDFLTKHPNGVLVNLGCGMDTRFYRIDDGRVHFFDLDLPPVIASKKALLPENERYHLIGQSVMEFGWMEHITALGNRPVMFQAEGLLMYLPEEQVRQLILKLQQRFPGCELVGEVVNKRWIQGIFKKMTAAKMKNRMNIGGGAEFLFGIADSRELEQWHSGIQYMGEWSYLDSRHQKLGWLGWLAGWQLFRKAQYTLHYRLN